MSTQTLWIVIAVVVVVLIVAVGLGLWLRSRRRISLRDAEKPQVTGAEPEKRRGGSYAASGGFDAPHTLQMRSAISPPRRRESPCHRERSRVGVTGRPGRKERRTAR